jgi:hypothetical protein
MNCKEFENKLIFFIDGSLAKDKMIDMKSHLDHCDNCKALHLKISAAFSFVEQDKITKVNPFFYNRLTERLAQGENKKSAIGKFKTREFYLQVVSYAAAIAIAIVLGISLGKSTDLNNDIVLENNNEPSEYQMFADSYNMSQPTEETYEIEINEYEEAQLNSNK